MTTNVRPTWLALLVLAFAGTGCETRTEETSIASSPTAAPEVIATTTPPAPEAKPEPAAVAPATTPTSEGNVTLEKVTYDELLKRVASKDAKFTIVDCWATWCGPCKENFPHVVQMHKKFADKGLKVVSLSFDDPANTKQVEDAQAFLNEKKAEFTNFLLNEGEGVGFEKFGVNSIPAVFLYSPDGKEIKRFTMDDPNNQFTYDEVEKTVEDLLAGKPVK